MDVDRSNPRTNAEHADGSKGKVTLRSQPSAFANYFGRLSTMAVFQQNRPTTITIKVPHISFSARPNHPDGLILNP